MITYAQALEIIYEAGNKKILGTEKISIELSIGRVLAESIYSPEDLPGFDNSAMDGFCVVSKETLTASQAHPIELSILDTIAAGDSKKFDPSTLAENLICFEIMTGAPLPHTQFDAVVKVEDVKRLGNKIILTRPILSKENVRHQGSDTQMGTLILGSGTPLSHQHLLMLAALGISEVSVFKKLKLALISTGKELAHYTEKELKPGQIRNSTAPYLLSLLNSLGFNVTYIGNIQDDPGYFKKKCDKIIFDDFDILLTTGAVSVGKFDFIKEVLTQMKTEILFHKSAIRPGKPILFGEFCHLASHHSVFFGMPGNPISTAVGVRFFLIPYLRCITKQPMEAPLLIELENEVRKPKDLRCFYKAKLTIVSSKAKVTVLPGQASFMVSPLLESSAWAVLPDSKEVFEPGEKIDVYPLLPQTYF